MPQSHFPQPEVVGGKTQTSLAHRAAGAVAVGGDGGYDWCWRRNWCWLDCGGMGSPED